MYGQPFYLAILTGPHFRDVICPFETEAQALAQVRAWMPTTAALTVNLAAGYVYFAEYGLSTETVRVERHVLALATPEDDETDDADADDPALLTAADRRLLRVVATLPPHERAAVSARVMDQEDA